MYTEDEYNEFAEKMESTYPKMFSQPYGGFAVGPGWWPIIKALCANIHGHIEWKREQRARDLVYNRRLARAIKENSIAPFIDAIKRSGKEPNQWQINDAEEALENRAFREVPNRVEHVVVAQIKEKFGGLRFYYDGGDEQVSGMVRMAEAWAGAVCEECGKPGKSRNSGWVKTLCDEHEAERQAIYKERFSNED